MLWFEPKTRYVYKLSIPDMRCGMCEFHIEDTIRKTVTVKKSRGKSSQGFSDHIFEQSFFIK